MNPADDTSSAPRAKIVCMLGTASSSPEALRALIDAGMDVARLNFSHGDHAEHRALLEHVRAAATAAGRVVAVLADLQGPKIRLGTFPAGPVTLETGAEFTITTEPRPGDADGASTTFADLARDVKPGASRLMVARGDLGVEMPLEQVPVVQKRAIRLARARVRPVIVATQMLDSMIEHSRPTRAEASDVANAVLDGADALMLSGETSVGRFPVGAVETMRRLIVATEQGASLTIAAPPPVDASHVSAAVAAAAVGVARDV